MAFFDLFIYHSLLTLTPLMLSLVPPSHTQGTPTIPSLPQESIFYQEKAYLYLLKR